MNESKNSNYTIEYYENNWESYIQDTVNEGFCTIQDRFLSLLRPDSHILDFGCGSGRDTKYFLSKGFRVSALDGSESFCRFATDYTGIPVRHVLFQDFCDKNLYDGIWACASLLHLPQADLVKTVNHIVDALKETGYLYCSFKYGDFQGQRNGRYFTDLTEVSFEKLILKNNPLTIQELWISEDVRPNRKTEQWLNIICRKEGK